MYSGLKVGSLHLWNHGYKWHMKSLFIALLPPQSVCREIKWWWPTKHLWRGWKRESRTSKLLTQTHSHKKDSPCIQAWLKIDTIPLWHTQLQTYTSSHGSPPEVSLWDWHTVGLVADFAHAVQWVRENSANFDPRHTVGLLWAFCMHTCMCLCMHAHACVGAHSIVIYSMLVSLLLVQAFALSLYEGLRESVRGGCQIRIRAALLIRWKTSHAPCFWMERHSLTCLFPLSSWHISKEL